MKNSIMVLFAILAIMQSCTKDNIKIDPDNLLIGIWNYSDSDDNTFLYTRSQDFVENYCYKFNTDGTLTERKNSGWCGTPPISYADYSGTWTALNDTLIQINVGYWGGTMTYKIDIEAIDSKSLKTIIIQGDN